MMRIKKLFIIIFCSVLLYSCYDYYTPIESQQGVYRYNLSSLYNPAESAINPECILYHENDQNSVVFFSQDVNELVVRNPEKNELEYGVRYILRDATSFALVDSASFNFLVNVNFNNEKFHSFFRINTPENKDYLMIVLFFCRNTNIYKRFLFEFNKSDKYSSSNYMVEKNSGSQSTLYNRFVNTDIQYRIKSERIGNSQVNVKYYKFDNQYPSPPYTISGTSMQTYIPDSIFIYNLGDTLTFDKKGTYFFQASTNVNSGLVLLNGGLYFPEIKTVEDMIDPLRYITGSREHGQLIKSQNQKHDIDEFWFSKSNNLRIAKEQIRVYYNRVQLANKFFSDYRQGYKTDRGMIYIMMGAPSVIKRNSDIEEWHYGEGNEMSGISFIFRKINHPISEFEYSLVRSTEFQTLWGQAISTWRGGRIFLIKN